MALEKPEWLRKKFSADPNIAMTDKLLNELHLNTVCREALCPNYAECFSKKTATFMILGVNCTRDCAFCNVTHGAPERPDSDEPRNIGRAVSGLGLRFVVITSVTRDDLQDGGAEQFAKVIREIRKQSPGTAIEVLIPDLLGDAGALRVIADAKPDVISHNMETVKELYSRVRPEAIYERSLNVIAQIKVMDPNIRSKSGIMVGLGESKEQVLALMDDLRESDCEFLTVGQYLAPSKHHLPVTEYIHPTVFDEYAAAATEKGFAFVASAPFVRSSYRAEEALAN